MKISPDQFCKQLGISRTALWVLLKMEGSHRLGELKRPSKKKQMMACQELVEKGMLEPAGYATDEEVRRLVGIEQ
jgi:hypothetical protein